MVTGCCPLPNAVTKKKTRREIEHDMQYVHRVAKDVLRQYVEDQWLRKVTCGPNPNPYVSFEIAQDQDGRIRVRMKARHDPFGQTVHTTEYGYWSWQYIDYDQLTNQLFHTLTFDGSPYYWYKTHFKKRMEIAG